LTGKIAGKRFEMEFTAVDEFALQLPSRGPCPANPAHHGVGRLAMLTGRILIQFIAGVFAVHYLRKHRPDIERPFKTWLYPLPNAIALLG
jgi:hypothetical protein